MTEQDPDSWMGLGHHQEQSNVIETPPDPWSDETPTDSALLNSSVCNCNFDVLTILLEKLNKHYHDQKRPNTSNVIL